MSLLECARKQAGQQWTLADNSYRSHCQVFNRVYVHVKESSVFR